jgi:hypothetical protein
LGLRSGNPHENIGGAVLNTTWFTTSGTMMDAQNVWQKRSRKTMTSDEIKVLNRCDLNTAVARWLGWVEVSNGVWDHPTIATLSFIPPRYSADLDAAHAVLEAIKARGKDAMERFGSNLCDLKGHFLEHRQTPLDIFFLLYYLKPEDICRAALMTTATDRGEPA